MQIKCIELWLDSFSFISKLEKKKNQTCQMCVEEEDKEKMLILFADANYWG